MADTNYEEKYHAIKLYKNNISGTLSNEQKKRVGINVENNTDTHNYELYVNGSIGINSNTNLNAYVLDVNGPAKIHDCIDVNEINVLTEDINVSLGDAIISEGDVIISQGALIPKTIKDSDGSLGQPGQILSSKGNSIKWINPVEVSNYYHITGNWNGLTYTAGKVGYPEDLAFTIPTGTSATTVAIGNHTHTTSIATSSDENQIILALGSKYAITAGGTSYVFTMPSNPNTDYKQRVTLATTSKAYITGVTTAPTSSNQYLTAVGDTGVYLTTTAGQMNATSYRVNEAVVLQYNSTTKSLDFVFL